MEKGDLNQINPMQKFIPILCDNKEIEQFQELTVPLCKLKNIKLGDHNSKIFFGDHKTELLNSIVFTNDSKEFEWKAGSIKTYSLFDQILNPNCDWYAFNENGKAWFCLTDGCNWGDKSKAASVNACETFIKPIHESFLQKLLKSDHTMLQYGEELLEHIKNAHNAIINSSVDTGTTTLVGGVFVTSTFDYNRYAVIAHIGDCNIYSFNHKSKELKLINHVRKTDKCDPGGRLGLYVSIIEGALPRYPDLRNLDLYIEGPIDDDTSIICCSDGVHDNFNPIGLGITPPPDQDEEQWVMQKEEEITKKLLSDDLKKSVDDILFYCLETTRNCREFMEQENKQLGGQGRRLPEDHEKYPGKLDDTTVMIIRAKKK